MSISAKLALELTVREVLAGNAPAASEPNKTITHDQFNTIMNLDGASGAPITKTAAFRQALSAGAATVNFAALTGTNGVAVDFTGLKIQAIMFKAPTTNTAAIVITPGATNGLDLLGASSSVSIKPGQTALFFLNEGAPDVASGERAIDLAGTGTEVLDIIAVAG